MKNLLKFEVPICRVSDSNVLDVNIKVEFFNTITIENDRNNAIEISTNYYSPKIGDKLYFLPGVNIPRVKLKQLILDYNIKIVKNVQEATAIFGNQHSLSKIINTAWYYTIPTKDFKVCIDLLTPSMDQHQVDKIKTALEFYEEELVYSDWASVYNLLNEDLPPYKNQIVNPGSLLNVNRSSATVAEPQEEYRELILNIENKEIFNEAELIENLNGDDAIIINDEVFEQLNKMFESTDTDNHIIAMEIMANSRYKESLLYIHLLFKHYANLIADNHTKNHVNFKSLLSYLNKDKYNLKSTLDGIVENLLFRKVLTT